MRNNANVTKSKQLKAALMLRLAKHFPFDVKNGSSPFWPKNRDETPLLGIIIN